MAEDDEVPDQRAVAEEKCKPSCSSYMKAYSACTERVAKDKTGEAHCTGQYFDYLHCIDACAAPVTFQNVK